MNRFRTLAIGGGAVAVLGVGALAMANRPEEDAADTSALFATAEVRDLEIVAEAPGEVEPIRTVEVKSKASGEVLVVHVETGDVVEQGTLLAEIDPRDVQNALDQAEADLESARVRQQTAEAQQRRMEALRETGAVTEQEYENAVQAATEARTAVVRAQTNLELARVRRNDVTIRAPTAGTIISRAAEPGSIIASATSNVSGGTTLFTMADLSEIQVRARVDETDVGRLVPGQEVQVTVEAYPGRVFPGRVLKIEPQAVVDQNITMFPVLIRLPNNDGALKPGMNAEVSVQIADRRGVTTVPNSAVPGQRDLNTIAEALGVSAEELAAATAPAGGRAARGDSGAAAAGEAPGAECMALFQKIREAGGPAGLSEADRARMAECRQSFQRRGGPGGAGGAGGARGRQLPGATTNRPGVIFVRNGDEIEPRRVIMGVSDWEHTEIVEGVEAGEEVVLVTVANLQRQQQEMSDRIRERQGGGVIPGAGGR